jgi:hypothetical protein
MEELKDSPDAGLPIACTITPGEVAEAATLFRALFAGAYVGRERMGDGVLWRFRADDGVEVKVRRLAAVERRCCAFLRSAVSAGGGEVRWELRGSEAARAFLDGYYHLPELISQYGETFVP